MPGSATDRRQAYRTLAEKHGMTPIELDSSGIGVGAGERAAEELMTLRERPTAVVAGTTETRTENFTVTTAANDAFLKQWAGYVKAKSVPFVPARWRRTPTTQ